MSAIVPNLSSPDAVKSAALQNPGLFTAAYAKAPVSVTYKGKTYLRAAARTVDQRLAYLAMIAMVAPSQLGQIGQSALYLDNPEFSLDPDRSGLDAAQAALRQAEADKRQAQALVTSRTAELRQYEANERIAAERLRDADRVQNVGDVLSLGIAVAGRVAYQQGQVQLWKDCQAAIKTGTVVGMCEQVKPAAEWQGKGIQQAQQALTQASATVNSARAEVAAAQRAYSEEARQLRQEEERARQQAARDAADQRRLEMEAAKRDAEAERQARAQNAATGATSAPNYQPDSVTTTDGNVVVVDDLSETEWADAEDASDFVSTYGDNEDMAEAMGIDLGPDAVAERAGISPWSFDRYYADADDMDDFFGADTAIVPIILAAILALAPIILQLFQPPPDAQKDAASAADNVALIAGGIGGALGPPAEKPAQQLSDSELEAARRKSQSDTTGMLLLLALGIYVASNEG